MLFIYSVLFSKYTSFQFKSSSPSNRFFLTSTKTSGFLCKIPFVICKQWPYIQNTNYSLQSTISQLLINKVPPHSLSYQTIQCNTLRNPITSRTRFGPYQTQSPPPLLSNPLNQARTKVWDEIKSWPGRRLARV